MLSKLSSSLLITRTFKIGPIAMALERSVSSSRSTQSPSVSLNLNESSSSRWKCFFTRAFKPAIVRLAISDFGSTILLILSPNLSFTTGRRESAVEKDAAEDGVYAGR